MKRLTVISRNKLNEILVFLTLIVSFAYVLPRWADPNQNSRLDMVIAVVEDHTFQIDKYVSNTVDYAKVGDHYYSDKAPGAAFLGIPVYFVAHTFLKLPFIDRLVESLGNNPAFQATLNPQGTGIFAQKVRFAMAQVILSFLLSAIPTAVIGILIYRLLALWKVDTGTRLFLVYAYALLTPAFAYANAFYGHQLNAALLFGAFYLIYSREKFTKPVLLGIGILLAYSFITEYPTLLISGILFLYLIYKLSRTEGLKGLPWLVIGGVSVLVPWMVYNNALFGGPLNLGYSHSELWTEQHHTGFMSLTMPRWETFWGITFGQFRGLFFYSPLLLLGIPGIFLWAKSQRYRVELIVAILVACSMLLFNASSIMWWGGFAVGPRYLLPMLPFWMLSLAFAFQSWKRKPVFMVASVALSLWSFIAVWGLTLAGQHFPDDAILNPLKDYALPAWQAGDIARNFGTLAGIPGQLSVIPLLIVILIGFGLHLYFNPKEPERR